MNYDIFRFMNRVPLDETKISKPSKKILAQILEWRPDWRTYAQMEPRGNGFDLHLQVPSPTGHTDRDIIVWFANDENDLSLGFGDWHAHGWEMYMPTSEPIDYRIPTIDFIKMIAEDRICAVVDFNQDNLMLVDLNDPDALLDELTSKHSSGCISIRSWGGTKDRQISI